MNIGKDEVMEEFLKHRFDDEMYDIEPTEDEDEDESLSELEEREYWHNVLADELRRWR